MTDTADTGRFDGAIQRARTALDDLRQQLAEKASEIGQEVNSRLDEIQTAIDEIQNAWAERPQPDNTLPGDLPPQPTQLPADQAQTQGGGTTPPPTLPTQ